MEKEIIELTKEHKKEKGLLTRLSFNQGIKTNEGLFPQIDISSKSLIISNDPLIKCYETMVFGVIGANDEEHTIIEETRTPKDTDMINNHWAMVTKYKNIYLNQ